MQFSNTWFSGPRTKRPWTSLTIAMFTVFKHMVQWTKDQVPLNLINYCNVHCLRQSVATGFLAVASPKPRSEHPVHGITASASKSEQKAIILCLPLKCKITKTWLCMKWHGAWFMVYTDLAPRWQQFHVAPAMSALKYTTLVDIQKSALIS